MPTQLEDMFKEDGMIFNPTPEQEEQDGYYEARARCNNCRYPKVITSFKYIAVLIRTGRLKPTGKYTCPCCKCKELGIY